METNTELRGEETDSSKMHVLERPTNLPGKCACCGAVNRPVVDFGVSVETEDFGYGVLYLCIDCIMQAGKKFGITEPMVIKAPPMSDKDIQRLVDGLTNGVTSIVTNWSDAIISADPEPAPVPEPEPVVEDKPTVLTGKPRTGKTVKAPDGLTLGEGSDGVSSFSL